MGNINMKMAMVILVLLASMTLDQSNHVTQVIFSTALAGEPTTPYEDDSGGSNPAMSWIEKTKYSDVIRDHGFCSEEMWEVLWPPAKAGDLEARAILFYFMMPPPHIPSITPPGSSGDLISRQRDITIMAVHSQAYDGPFERGYKDMAYDQFISAGFSRSSAGFLKCVKTSEKNCADIAVKAKLVPSFEEYARQIDAMEKVGMKAVCR